ncbi:MAG: YjcZ family sporulation protein [bacterium]
MYYQGMPGYGYGYQPYQTCCNDTSSKSYGYALILVLFILLVIIGAARF